MQLTGGAGLPRLLCLFVDLKDSRLLVKHTHPGLSGDCNSLPVNSNLGSTEEFKCPMMVVVELQRVFTPSDTEDWD